MRPTQPCPPERSGTMDGPRPSTVAARRRARRLTSAARGETTCGGGARLLPRQTRRSAWKKSGLRPRAASPTTTGSATTSASGERAPPGRPAARAVQAKDSAADCARDGPSRQASAPSWRTTPGRRSARHHDRVLGEQTVLSRASARARPGIAPAPRGDVIGARPKGVQARRCRTPSPPPS